MKPLTTTILVVLCALVASCGGPVPPQVDPSRQAIVLTAAGTVRNAAVTLDVQIGEALAPRPVVAGETTLTPSGAINP
jgi:hypothetical protein